MAGWRVLISVDSRILRHHNKNFHAVINDIIQQNEILEAPGWKISLNGDI